MSKNRAPSFLIHLTGTGCISDELENKWEGKANPHVWHDINEIQEIYDLPDEAIHHVVDKAVMNASNELLKTACICPPDIYGQNMGTGNRTTFLVPEYVKALLGTKEAFYLGDGQNFRAVTHISDVVKLFLILTDNAVRGGGEAQWGREVRVDSSSQLSLLPTTCRASILVSPMKFNGKTSLPLLTSLVSKMDGFQLIVDLYHGVQKR